MTVKALIVYPDGAHSHSEIEGDLASLQDIVSGDIEYVFVGVAGGKTVHAYVNDMGKHIAACEPNHFATSLIPDLDPRDTIRGIAVFLGEGEDDEEGDVPEDFVRLADQSASILGWHKR